MRSLASMHLNIYEYDTPSPPLPPPKFYRRHRRANRIQLMTTKIAAFAAACRAAYFADCRSAIDDDDISDTKPHFESEESDEFCEHSALSSLKSTVKSESLNCNNSIISNFPNQKAVNFRPPLFLTTKNYRLSTFPYPVMLPVCTCGGVITRTALRSVVVPSAETVTGIVTVTRSIKHRLSLTASQ